MATTNYGIDLAAPAGPDGFDLDPFGMTIEGVPCLAQNIAHRLVTPRGSLLDSARWGYDVRQHLNDSLDDAGLSEIERAVTEECRADERVDDASVVATFDGERLALVILVRPIVGRSFTMVLAVSSVTVELLSTAAGG